MAEEKRSYYHMVPLEPRERQIGYAAAALSLVLTLVFWLPHLSELTSHAHVNRIAGQYSASSGLIIGITSTVVIAWASWSRKRLLLGISALFTGEFNPWGATPLLYGLPFLVLAGWQLVRWSRFAGLRVDARRARAEQEKAAGESVGLSGRGRSRGTYDTASSKERSRNGRHTERRSRRGERSDDSTRPSASKRYTPPKR